MHECQKCGYKMDARPNFCPACGVSITYSSTGDLDPIIGRTIDDTYKVVESVGEGAMGRVYRAEHIQLKKQVALKILRSNLISDTTVVKRFEREAQAASRLNHPNCISMFGYGRDDDGTLLWMAMEFIQGRDLGTIIAEDSPLPAQRVLHIMSQVCDALDEAHAANVIHRDLKPANIICFDHRRTPDFVKVLDFGIAKIMDSENEYQPLTREGIVCGTPAYMSPEQVQGLELDARSDLFSLGIILYQTLTGRLPFLGDSAVEVATKIVVDQPISPSTARSDWSYPPEFEQIVLKLLSKNRDDRYFEAHEVKEALSQCLSELQDRRDASLDLRPDELAQILADVDGGASGTDTIRVSEDLVAQALAGPMPERPEDTAPEPELAERRALSGMDGDTSPPEGPPVELLERPVVPDEPDSQVNPFETASVDSVNDVSRPGSQLKTTLLFAVVAALVAFLLVYMK